jgi:hypothetical protein
MLNERHSTFTIQHFSFNIRERSERFGTGGRLRTGDPQIHNLVL